jgi:hypothetical protein
MENEVKIREEISGSRRFENYLWTVVLFIGGSGFILVSLSSALNTRLVPFLEIPELNFVPQGVLMLFYGLLGVGFSIYLSLLMFWDVGGGYNEFDKTNATIRIVRRGTPGENRNVMLSYSFNEIKLIEARIREGINPRRTIYLVTMDQRKIPLTAAGQPLPLFELEQKAIQLAKFLEIPYNYANEAA